LPLARKAVESCRNEIKGTKVILTDQLTTLLEEWEHGLKLSGVPPRVCAAPVVAPDSCAGPSGPQALAPVAQAPLLAEEVGPAKVGSLAERMRSAKKRKVSA
jgi:hypothetical protein